MKKIRAVLRVITCMVLGLAACGNADGNEQSQPAQTEEILGGGYAK